MPSKLLRSPAIYQSLTLPKTYDFNVILEHIFDNGNILRLNLAIKELLGHHVGLVVEVLELLKVIHLLKDGLRALFNSRLWGLYAEQTIRNVEAISIRGVATAISDVIHSQFFTEDLALVQWHQNLCLFAQNAVTDGKHFVAGDDQVWFARLCNSSFCVEVDEAFLRGLRGHKPAQTTL